jgi:hydroxymethylpyrimidine/phosphomethylpyrimidine kinase
MRHTALTIAGSDSSGGAGIQADLKAFAALGVFGQSALTAITAQNGLGVTRVLELPVSLVIEQIDTTVRDVRPAAAKTGMLSSIEIIEAVADAIARHKLTPYVCDPVMVSKAGSQLLQADAKDAIVKRLVPLATMITPNRFECGVLCGRTIGDGTSLSQFADMAKQMLDAGARNVIIKAIPSGDRIIDLFVGREMTIESIKERLADGRNHGSGCTFSAGICAGLALGMELLEASALAERLTRYAIENAMEQGSGVRAVNVLGFSETD